MVNVSVSVEVCVGTCCHLMGAGDMLSFLESLNERLTEATLDVTYATCMGKGACDCLGCPKVRIDGHIIDQATPDGVQEFILGRVKLAQGA